MVCQRSDVYAERNGGPCGLLRSSPMSVLVLNCQGGSKEEITKDMTATLTAALYSSGNNRMVVSYERQSDNSE